MNALKLEIEGETYIKKALMNLKGHESLKKFSINGATCKIEVSVEDIVE